MSKKSKQQSKNKSKNHLNLPKQYIPIVVGLIILGTAVLGKPDLANPLINLLGLDNNWTSPTSKTTTSTDSLPDYGTVVKVSDGDTIKLEDGRSIRFLNIDTPESVKPQTPVQCYAKEASEFTKTLLDGQKVWLKSDKQKTDRYNRDLRFVFLSEADTADMNNSVNAQLIKLGFAREVTYKPNDTYQEFFQKLQFEAQEKKLGVWNCPDPFKK